MADHNRKRRASGAMGSGDASGSSGTGGGHRDPSGTGGCPWSAPAAPAADIEAAHDEAAADEAESVEMRLEGLEGQMGRLCKMVGDLRREHAEMAAILHQVQGHVSAMQTWTSWLGRVYDWFANSVRDFPWH